MCSREAEWIEPMTTSPSLRLTLVPGRLTYIGHWVTPVDALARNREGRFPMVFPTIMTLQALSQFSDPREALRILGAKKIPRFLPRLEEARDGVRMILEASMPDLFLPA